MRARSFLINGFVNEILDKINEPNYFQHNHVVPTNFTIINSEKNNP